jgi:hypothetical protein
MYKKTLVTRIADLHDWILIKLTFLSCGLNSALQGVYESSRLFLLRDIMMQLSPEPSKKENH